MQRTRTRRMGLWAGICIALGALQPLRAQVQEPSAAERFGSLRHAVHEAREHGDGAAYLKNALELQRLLNGSPTSTVDVMAAQVASGHLDQALQSLKTLADMGQSYADLLGTPLFKAMRSLPGYPAVAAAMTSNTRPQSLAEPVFELRTAEWVPEDIDYDAGAKRFLITSVMKSQVLAVNWNGADSVFATSPDGWPMMALKIDSKRGRVWVTEVRIGKSQSAILIYDLKTSRLLHRIGGPTPTDLGDMALMDNGDAIVSDGGHGGVYRIDAKTFKTVRLDHGEFISPQTPAIAGIDRVWIPDYTRGIGLLNLNSKTVAWLTTEKAHALGGVDGLYYYEHSLIVTQNGASPERVAQFMLNEGDSRITSERNLERATSTLGDPTHGVIVGEYFYYIANSGWDALDDNAHRKPGHAMTPARLMRVKLGHG